MSLFRTTKRGGVGCAWEFKAQGIIWRVVPAANSKILGEERDLEHRSTTFFCLNQANGKPLWKGVSLGDPWWIGIEAVVDGVFILHLFATPELPVHKGIIAVDIETGKPLWSSLELTFRDTRGESLFAARVGRSGENIVEVDLRSGSILRELEDRLSPEQVSNSDDGIQFSSPLDRNSKASELFRHSPRQAISAGPVEIIDDPQFVAFSQIEKSGTEDGSRHRYSNRIFVLEAAGGNEVYSDVANEDVESMAPEAMILREHALLYVRGRRTLVAVHLPP